MPLEYTAPEQCYEDIYENTDVFGLGVIVYEAIFGRCVAKACFQQRFRVEGLTAVWPVTFLIYMLAAFKDFKGSQFYFYLLLSLYEPRHEKTKMWFPNKSDTNRAVQAHLVLHMHIVGFLMTWLD